jgi:hypothetical protein
MAFDDQRHLDTTPPYGHRKEAHKHQLLGIRCAAKQKNPTN